MSTGKLSSPSRSGSTKFQKLSWKAMRVSAAPGSARRPVIMTAKRQARSHCTSATSAKAASTGSGLAWVARRPSDATTSGVSRSQRQAALTASEDKEHEAERPTRVSRGSDVATPSRRAADVLPHQVARLHRPLRAADDELGQHAEQDQLDADDHRQRAEQQQRPAADAGAGQQLEARQIGERAPPPSRNSEPMPPKRCAGR